MILIKIKLIIVHKSQLDHGIELRRVSNEKKHVFFKWLC